MARLSFFCRSCQLIPPPPPHSGTLPLLGCHFPSPAHASSSVVDLTQIVVNQPSLLTLSVPSNLRPKVALFRDELGARESDIADLINNCPRVMNASVKGRILPRVQVRDAFAASLLFDLPCSTYSLSGDMFDVHASIYS